MANLSAWMRNEKRVAKPWGLDLHVVCDARSRLSLPGRDLLAGCCRASAHITAPVSSFGLGGSMRWCAVDQPSRDYGCYGIDRRLVTSIDSCVQ